MSPAEEPLKLAVLASGSGTNLEAVFKEIEQGRLPVEVVVVISDNSRAFALERARSRGVPAVVLELKGFPDRRSFDRAVQGAVTESGAELIVLAGYMKLVSDEMVSSYRGRIMNIHPALLPSFPGEHGVSDALEHGVKVSGVTVHFVDEGLDTGPIIVQVAVPVEDSDDVESLHQRIHGAEYEAYPEAIRLFAQGRLVLEGRKVRVLPPVDAT